MSGIQELEESVRNLYESKILGRADWADWLYANHVFVVTNLMSDFTPEQARDWTAKKIERDLEDKIAFDEVRLNTKDNYYKLRKLFKP
jgi:hypothetical protein